MLGVKEIEQGEKGLEGLTEEELEKLIEEKKEDYDYYDHQSKIKHCVGNTRRFLYVAKEYYELLVEKAKKELDYASKKHYDLLVEQAKNESGGSENFAHSLIRILQNSKKLPAYLRNIIKRSILIIKTNTAITSRKQALDFLSNELGEYSQDYDSTFKTTEAPLYDSRKP